MATSNLPPESMCRAFTDDTHLLGTDKDGNKHYTFSVPLVSRIVTPDGELGCIQQLPSVGEYVDHVDDVCGWQNVRYDDRPLGDVVADAVAEARCAE